MKRSTPLKIIPLCMLALVGLACADRSLSQTDDVESVGSVNQAVEVGVNLAVNPGFESGMTGWTTLGDASADFTESGGVSGQRLTHWSSSNYDTTTQQTVTGLDDGIYRLTAQLKGGASTQAYIFVNGYGGSELRTNIPNVGDTWNTFTVDNVNVTSGQATFGLRTQNSEWMSMDNVDFELVTPGGPPPPPPPPGGSQAVQILANHGFNYARIRVLVNPPYTYGLYQDTNYVIALAQDAKNNGMSVLLDFFYSDWWADPGQQNLPSGWSSNTSTAAGQLASHTTSVLNAMNAAGVLPDMVQVGNEVNSGMAWPAGEITWNPTNMSNFITMANAGYNAVKSVSSSIPVMIQVAGVADAPWWFSTYLGAGGQADVLGLSFYVTWHGAISGAVSALNDLASLGRDTYIVETAAYWTASSGGNSTPGWPQTKQGQYDFLYTLTDSVKNIPRLRGIFYWGATWAQEDEWSSIDDDAETRALFDTTPGNNIATLNPAADALVDAGGLAIRGADISEATWAEQNGVVYQDSSGPVCGNGSCESGETCSSCSQDCGACQFCGDGSCNNGETCSSCSQDCGTCGPGSAIWIEAESGAMSGNPTWSIDSDASASGGQSISPTSNDTGSPGPNRAAYTFSSDAGSFLVWGRVIAPNGSDDSFWVSMDGGAFVRWNDLSTISSWGWVNVWDSDNGGAVVNYNLSAGTHTLEIANREDGVRLDKLYITALGDTPSGLGGGCTPATCGSLGAQCGSIGDGCGGNLNCGSCGSGETCNGSNQCVASCTPATCGSLGAQCGSIGDGCGGTLNCGSCGSGETCNGSNQCVASCTPATCGSLGAQCGSIGDGCGGNLNCGSCSAGFSCNGSNQCIQDPFCGDGSCNNGEDCSSCSQDCGSCGGGSDAIWIEAEDGVMSGNPTWSIDSDASASGGQSISPTSNNTGSPGPNRATYMFTSNAGTFRVWGRVIAPNGNDDSFWVSMDGGAFVKWNQLSTISSWGWVNVWDSDNGNAVVNYTLSAGAHTLEIANREDGVRLDKLYITSLGDTPSGLGGGCTPDCSGLECGSDGCGGSCGTCSGGEVCNASQQCEAGSGPVMFQMSGGSVSMEAESYDAIFGSGNSSDAFGNNGGVMECGPDDGNYWTSGIESNAPRLEYEVNFTSTGTFFAHVRAAGPNGSGDSVHIGLDGAVVDNRLDVNSANNLSWANSSSFTVNSSGQHTIIVYAREDGVRVDQIIVNQSSGTPTWSGESPRN